MLLNCPASKYHLWYMNERHCFVSDSLLFSVIQANWIGTFVPYNWLFPHEKSIHSYHLNELLVFISACYFHCTVSVFSNFDQHVYACVDKTYIPIFWQCLKNEISVIMNFGKIKAEKWEESWYAGFLLRWGSYGWDIDTDGKASTAMPFGPEYLVSRQEGRDIPF